MSSIKIERLNHTIQQEISMILQTEVKDSHIKFVTITGVDVTNDLSFAKVYFTTLDDREHVEHDLNNAAGFFRSLLAERLIMRHTPELRFIYDKTEEYGSHIDKLINKIHEEETEK